MLVHLIEQPNVGPWAGLAFVGTDRPEEGIGVRIKQVPDFFVAPRLHEPGAKFFRHVHHRHGIAKQDHRLIALGGRRINFSALFTVGNQPVKADPTNQWAFTRALASLDVAQSETPITVNGHPAKQTSDHKCLPGSEQERHAFVITAVEAKHIFEKADRTIGFFQIPNQTASRSVFEVTQMTFRGVANVGTGDNFAGQYGMGKGGDAIVN
ncbi:hypothetical protein D3C86_1580660 [compost metagenome]